MASAGDTLTLTVTTTHSGRPSYGFCRRYTDPNRNYYT